MLAGMSERYMSIKCPRAVHKFQRLGRALLTLNDVLCQFLCLTLWRKGSAQGYGAGLDVMGVHGITVANDWHHHEQAEPWHADAELHEDNHGVLPELHEDNHGVLLASFGGAVVPCRQEVLRKPVLA